MKTLNALLDLPEYATASQRAVAVMDIMRENEDISAALNRAEYVLAGLRGQTSRIFASAVCAQHGITDTSVYEDIRAAWEENPHSALEAFPDTENISAYNPWGCNQWGHYRGHKPGTSSAGSKGKNLADALKKRSERAEEHKKQPPKKKQDAPAQSEQQEKKEEAPKEEKPKKEKTEVDKMLEPAEELSKKENDLYKKLLRGGLSKEEEEKTLKEWGDAHTAFWNAEYETNKHAVSAADSPEFLRRRMNMAEKIDRHFDELSELYPHAIN